MMLHAQRSQYCLIWCLKIMKNFKRSKHTFAPRIDSKGSYIQKEFPLFSSIGFLGKKNVFVLPAEEQPCESSPVKHPDYSWDIFFEECVAAQWTPILFLFLEVDKFTCFKILRRWELKCVCVCMCLNLPLEQWERLLGMCSWKIMHSSPLWGQAVPALLSDLGYLLPAHHLLHL